MPAKPLYQNREPLVLGADAVEVAILAALRALQSHGWGRIEIIVKNGTIDFYQKTETYRPD